MRILILLVIVAILLLLLKRLFAAAPAPRRLADRSENMRQCRYCGVHVPESAIVTVDGEPYCSQDHADLDRG